jgi:hypothetical protein
MIELGNFYNDGTGWICRQCERELAASPEDSNFPSRIFEEGEAESKTPKLASPARAKWTDATRRSLICPRCGVSELVEKN